MAEAALFLGWGTPVRGREKAALDVFNESMQFYGRCQQDGRIESFDVAVLTPTGGELGGFILVRGTAQQVDALRRDEEYQQLLIRVQLITDHLRIADGFVDEQLGQQITRYEKSIGQFA